MFGRLRRTKEKKMLKTKGGMICRLFGHKFTYYYDHYSDDGKMDHTILICERCGVTHRIDFPEAPAKQQVDVNVRFGLN